MTNVEPSYRRAIPGLLLLAAGMFVVGTNAFVIAGLLPDIASGLATTPSTVSLSITAYSLTVAVAAPLVSIFLVRVPRHVLMAAGMLVFCLGVALTAISGTMAMFTAGRVLAGLGGAALMPTAIAAASALVPAERRGRAIALVGTGFSLATALGAPLGTALGDVAGWRLPLWLLVAAGAAVAVGTLFGLRRVPLAPPIPLSRRIEPLRRPRVVAVLVAVFLVIAAFNTVYIFISSVLRPATGGSGLLLSVLLLAYGVAGVAGNALAGPLTDRFGSRVTATSGLLVQLVILTLLPLLDTSFPLALVAVIVWGVAAFTISVPAQHRLVELDPSASAITLSWYSTAMYLGIAIAPIAGSAALLDGAAAVPLVGAGASLLALLVLQLAYRSRPAQGGLGTGRLRGQPTTD